MTRGCQYGELAIIDKKFPPIDPSVMGASYNHVVEIGAADGIDNSNSFDLLQRHNWAALLVEPHPGYFMDLIKLYNDDLRVRLANYAVAGMTTRRRLGLDGQCSSFVHSKPISIEVQCVTLTELLDLYKIRKDFEFLSIDCEGLDMEVLASLNWHRYRPQLVCVEHSMPKSDLHAFMESVNYKFYATTLGNTFFESQ